MADKIYVGVGWEKVFSNGGSVINISLKKAKLEELEANDYGDIKLVVGKRREQDSKTKATHWVAVDDYRR